MKIGELIKLIKKEAKKMYDEDLWYDKSYEYGAIRICPSSGMCEHIEQGILPVHKEENINIIIGKLIIKVHVVVYYNGKHYAIEYNLQDLEIDVAK